MGGENGSLANLHSLIRLPLKPILDVDDNDLWVGKTNHSLNRELETGKRQRH